MGQRRSRLEDVGLLRITNRAAQIMVAPIIGEGGRPDTEWTQWHPYRRDASAEIPSLDWEEYVRLQERDEYSELVEYGLRQPADYADVLKGQASGTLTIRSDRDDLDGL